MELESVQVLHHWGDSALPGTLMYGFPHAAHGMTMLVAYSFRAKPGKEREFEALLDNPESGMAVAKAMGATRNTLFLGGGRMVRVFEFREGVKPVALHVVAERSPDLKAFLRKLGPLVEDGFDVDKAGSLEAFNDRARLGMAYDVRP